MDRMREYSIVLQVVLAIVKQLVFLKVICKFKTK